MSLSLSPLHRAPYLAGSDILGMSSGSPGASVSGASISAQGEPVMLDNPEGWDGEAVGRGTQDRGHR